MSSSTFKRSLVTGGAGFIGSHLVDALVQRGDRVEVIDDLSTGRHQNLDGTIERGAVLHEVDLRDADRVAEIVTELEPQQIFHLAAQADVRKAVADPDLDAEVNVVGTINLLEAARAVGAPGVVYAATGGAVYGEGADKSLPLSESTPAAPETPYGASKLAGEVYVGLYRRLHRVPGVALRFANVYGPRQDPHGEAGVVAIFCGLILEGERPRIFGDGKQTRDFVYVADVVEAILAAAATLAERGTGFEGPINIGTGIESSVLDLVEVLEAASGSEVEVTHEPARTGEVNRISIDPSRAADELGWEPRTSLERGLAETFEWIRTERKRGGETSSEVAADPPDRTVEAADASEFSQALAQHLDCGGSLELIDGEEPGTTGLRCGGCGAAVLHREEALDLDKLQPPVGASATALMPESLARRLAAKDSEDAEAKALASSITRSGPDLHEETGDRTRRLEGPDAGKGRRGRGRRGGVRASKPGPPSVPRRFAERFERTSFPFGLPAFLLVAVAVALVLVLVVVNGGSDPVSIPLERTQTVGPITAEVPPAWSVDRPPSGPIDAQFVSEDGAASVSVVVDEGSASVEELTAAAGELLGLLVDLTDNVVIESERIGNRRATVIASYDDGTFEATVKRNEDLGLISIANLAAAAPPEVQARALELSQGVSAAP
ncbi:MAG: GDP-mannose 4,6-dehydratase [Solirubrobacterales bacterium]